MFYEDHMLEWCRVLNMLSSSNKDVIIIIITVFLFIVHEI